MQCPSTHNSKNKSCQSCPLSSSCSKSDGLKFDFKQFENKKGLLIMSGKGGVGKSSISRMIAHTVVKSLKPENSICIIDADIKGPSLGRLFNIEEIIPKESLPYKINNQMYLISNSIIDTPIPLPSLLNMFIPSPILIIDTPPGISDEHLFLKDLSNNCKLFALIITTPDDICISDVRRQLYFLKRLDIHILGLIVNMSGFICEYCLCENNSVLNNNNNNVESISKEFNIQILGELPCKKEIARKCDNGEIFEEEFFKEIYQKIKGCLFKEE